MAVSSWALFLCTPQMQSNRSSQYGKILFLCKKKYMGFFRVFLFLFCIAYAQKGWYVGARVVPLTSWMLNQQDMDAPASQFTYEWTYGVAGGFGGGYAFTTHLALMADLLYSSQGQKHSYQTIVNNQVDTVFNELRLRMVKLPVMFRVSTNTERKYAWIFQLGPQVDYLVSVKEYDMNPAYPHDNQLPHDPPGQPDFYNVPKRYDTFKRWNLSAVAQTGLEIKLRFNLKMHAHLRVDYGITDIENKSATYDVYQYGQLKTVPFYSETTRPHYKEGRPATHNLTAGVLIGFSYVFIPRLHY